MRLTDTTESFMVARGYSGESRRQRLVIINGFIDHTGNPTCDDITPADMIAWWATKSDRKPATRRAYLTVIRLWWRHNIAMGWATSDPTILIATPRIPNRPPVSLRAAEIETILAVPRTPRNRAILTLMLGCGLRSGDLQRVNIEDVDMGHRVIRVRVKGGDELIKPVPRIAAEDLAVLLDTLPSHGPLIRVCGRRISVSRLRAVVTAMLVDAGVKRDAHDGRSPHILRRTFATELLRAGVNVKDVQDLMGHDSLTSTQRYLAPSDAGELLEAVELGPLSVSYRLAA